MKGYSDISYSLSCYAWFIAFSLPSSCHAYAFFVFPVQLYYNIQFLVFLIEVFSWFIMLCQSLLYSEVPVLYIFVILQFPSTEFPLAPFSQASQSWFLSLATRQVWRIQWSPGHVLPVSCCKLYPDPFPSNLCICPLMPSLWYLSFTLCVKQALFLNCENLHFSKILNINLKIPKLS